MNYPAAIAIDGPVASGKTTIGYQLAQRLGYLYLDTGVLYRAVTWAVLQRHISVEDETAVTELAYSLPIEVSPSAVEDGRKYTVSIADEDITWAIRAPEVDSAVSPVSAYRGVREALTRQMRHIARRGRVVMVGRDIGTVVLPDAPLKLYVTASAEERAQRRYLEVQEQGCALSYTEVLNAIRRRDEIDSSRKVAPLKPAADAVVVDTTTLSPEEVLQQIELLLNQIC